MTKQRKPIIPSQHSFELFGAKIERFIDGLTLEFKEDNKVFKFWDCRGFRLSRDLRKKLGEDDDKVSDETIRQITLGKSRPKTETVQRVVNFLNRYIKLKPHLRDDRPVDLELFSDAVSLDEFCELFGLRKDKLDIDQWFKDGGLNRDFLYSAEDLGLTDVGGHKIQTDGHLAGLYYVYRVAALRRQKKVERLGLVIHKPHRSSVKHDKKHVKGREFYIPARLYIPGFYKNALFTYTGLVTEQYHRATVIQLTQDQRSTRDPCTIATKSANVGTAGLDRVGYMLTYAQSDQIAPTPYSIIVQRVRDIREDLEGFVELAPTVEVPEDEEESILRLLKSRRTGP